jgi:hypothetical protein
MHPTRREFLASAGLLAAGSALPLSLMRTPPPALLDALHEQAQSLARRLHGDPPGIVLVDAGAHLDSVTGFLGGAMRPARTRLHRTAALTALVAAYASHWAGGPDTLALLDRAEPHAAEGDDPVLRAQVHLLRGLHLGAPAHAIGAPSAEAVHHLTRALRVAGTGAPPILRSLIRYDLASEFALQGDARGAWMELDAADWEYQRAAHAEDVVDVADGCWRTRRWDCGYRGGVLIKLKRHGEAIAACSQVLHGPALWQTGSMTGIARCHAARDDVDAAAAMLEDAYLLNRQAGLEQRQQEVYAVRALLPDTPAVRQLDAVMRG